MRDIRAKGYQTRESRSERAALVNDFVSLDAKRSTVERSKVAVGW